MTNGQPDIDRYARLLGISTAQSQTLFVRELWDDISGEQVPANTNTPIADTTQGTVLWRYLRLFAIPYGFTVDPEIRVPAAWLGVAAWLAIGAALAALWRWRRDLAIWLTAAALLLLPSSSIFPAADLAADRRMYLALLPLAAAAALLLVRLRMRAWLRRWSSLRWWW